MYLTVNQQGPLTSTAEQQAVNASLATIRIIVVHWPQPEPHPETSMRPEPQNNNNKKSHHQSDCSPRPHYTHIFRQIEHLLNANLLVNGLSSSSVCTSACRWNSSAARNKGGAL
jgi:hypothetical protein